MVKVKSFKNFKKFGAMAMAVVSVLCVTALCGTKAFAGTGVTDSGNKATTDICLKTAGGSIDTDGDGEPDSESLEGVVSVPAKIVGVFSAKDGSITYPTSGLTVKNDSAFDIHLSALDYTENAASGLTVADKPAEGGTLADSTYYTDLTIDGKTLGFKALTAKSSLTEDRVCVTDKSINIDDTMDFSLTGAANAKGASIGTDELQVGTLSWWFGTGILA